MTTTNLQCNRPEKIQLSELIEYQFASTHFCIEVLPLSDCWFVLSATLCWTLSHSTALALMPFQSERYPTKLSNQD